MGSQTAWLTRVCWPKQHVYLNTYIISNSTQNYLQFAEVWQKLQRLSLQLEKTKNDSGNNNTKNINHSADHLPQLQTQFGSCETFSGENFCLQNLLFQHTIISVTRGNLIMTGSKLFFSLFPSLVYGHSGLSALSSLAHYSSHMCLPQIFIDWKSTSRKSFREVDVGSKGLKRFRITAIRIEQVKIRKMQDQGSGVV